MRRIFLVLAWALPLAAPAQELPLPGGSARVDWYRQVVSAVGLGPPDATAPRAEEARRSAERAARQEAARNLLEGVKGIPIGTGRTVGEAMAEEGVRKKVEAAVRDFRLAGKRYYSDGGVAVEAELPLGALTELFIDAAQPEPVEGEGRERPRPAKHSGLIVDARGFKLAPALCARILDQGGTELYGPSVLAEEARKKGVAAYAPSLEEARRSTLAGEKPLILKAAGAQGTDLVLSPAEAKRLLDESHGFLAQGRVVIVL